MSENNITIKELKSIVEWVNTSNDVRELSLKFGEVELFMSRNEQPRQTTLAVKDPEPTSKVDASADVSSLVVATSPVADKPIVSSESAELAEGDIVIKAPMVGTFYSAPRPGAEDFVVVGMDVQESSVLGIVEVMKLMNNVEAKTTGKISRILVSNGEAVEYGQPLMIISK